MRRMTVAFTVIFTCAVTGTALPAPLIVHTQTVALDAGDACGASSMLSVPIGTALRWCFHVQNTGDVTLQQQDLETDRFGMLLSDFPFVLLPGATAFLTQADVAAAPGSSSFASTWTAFNPGPLDVVSSSSSATIDVIPASIDLDVTAALDTGLDECGTKSTIKRGARKRRPALLSHQQYERLHLHPANGR